MAVCGELALVSADGRALRQTTGYMSIASTHTPLITYTKQKHSTLQAFEPLPLRKQGVYRPISALERRNQLASKDFSTKQSATLIYF